jgi:hypothetical protein
VSGPGPELPLACSLDAAGLAERGRGFRSLSAAALLERRREEGRVVLRFRPDEAVETEVRALAARERERCQFFDIRVRAAGDAVEPTIAAPAGAQPLLDDLFAGAG